MHIAIASHSLCLGRGGSERVAVELATHMLLRGHTVTLHSWGDLQGNVGTPAYPIPTGAVHRAWNGSQGAAEEVARLRQYLMDSGTDVFISLQSNNQHLFWATACLGTGIAFIYSERNCPDFVISHWSRVGRNAALSSADVIHLLLPCYAISVPEIWQSKIRIIPNATQGHMPLADVDGLSTKVLLYMGRMVEDKRPELLLRAFAMLRDKHPDWRLEIWGDGPEATRLRRLMNKMGGKGRVRLCGLCLDPPAAYAEAQLYCLPTRIEGFPNTVLEAMSAGLPVVGVADCEGMREIVTPNVNGLLAYEATPQSLAAKLNALMSDSNMRRRLGEGARQTAGRYAPQKIYDQWEAMLAEMTVRKGATVMDDFADEPFATQAALSRLARQEWLFRYNGEPMPYSF